MFMKLISSVSSRAFGQQILYGHAARVKGKQEVLDLSV